MLVSPGTRPVETLLLGKDDSGKCPHTVVYLGAVKFRVRIKSTNNDYNITVGAGAAEGEHY